MPKKKGQTSVTIYQDWCKGCGICVAFCPSKVMELDQFGKAQVIREQECINCGFCELHCPDFAISVRPKDETIAEEGQPTPASPKGQEATPAPDAPEAKPQNDESGAQPKPAAKPAADTQNPKGGA